MGRSEWLSVVALFTLAILLGPAVQSLAWNMPRSTILWWPYPGASVAAYLVLVAIVERWRPRGDLLIGVGGLGFGWGLAQRISNMRDQHLANEIDEPQPFILLGLVFGMLLVVLVLETVVRKAARPIYGRRSPASETD